MPKSHRQRIAAESQPHEENHQQELVRSPQRGTMTSEQRNEEAECEEHSGGSGVGIQCRDLYRVYRAGTGDIRTVAVDHVNLTIEPGEFVAVTGPSGSGKSSLLNLVAALDRPDGGRVVVGGMDLARADKNTLARYRRDTLGIVFQDSVLIPELSVHANVAVPAMLAGGRRADVSRRVMDLLGRLGLDELGDRTPDELSGGQRQRVAVARAMVNKPGLVVADEPTGNLDTAQGMLVVEMLRQAHATGTTVFLITHDPRIAASAEREVHIVDGKLVS